MRVRFEYWQDFMGKTIKASNIHTVNDMSEIPKIIKGYYSDPHVFYVDFEVLEEKSEV